MEEHATPPPTDDASLLKSKPKREQSDKQKEVWKKAQETRLANAKLKKDALAKAKEDIENKKKPKPIINEVLPTPSPLASKPKKEPKIIYEQESDSEPEIVVVKKKKKKIIYEEESSEDEIPVPKPRKTKAFELTPLPPPPAPAPAPIKTQIFRFF